jgi:hypothetical protein
MQRASLAVSTWFRLPEYMSRLEILSRGSAFRLATGGVVASAHVLAPWRFPNYFPEEWVKSVRPEHTRYFLERRSAAGVVEACTEASSPVCHAEWDAAVLTPIDATALDVLGAPALDLALGALEDGAALAVDGHNIEDAGEDDDLVIPELVAGAYAGRLAGGPQHFLRTNSRLEQGQCGAPVILFGSTCVGVVEGIVPANHPLAGLAAFVPAAELAELVAAEAVASDGPPPESLAGLVV